MSSRHEKTSVVERKSAGLILLIPGHDKYLLHLQSCKSHISHLKKNMAKDFSWALLLILCTAFHARARAVTSAFAGGHFDQIKLKRPTSGKNLFTCMAGVASPKVRVFLVRHGAVDLNTPGMVYPKDCFYGGQNVPLSSLGKIEAQVLRS